MRTRAHGYVWDNHRARVKKVCVCDRIHREGEKGSLRFSAGVLFSPSPCRSSFLSIFPIRSATGKLLPLCPRTFSSLAFHRVPCSPFCRFYPSSGYSPRFVQSGMVFLVSSPAFVLVFPSLPSSLPPFSLSLYLSVSISVSVSLSLSLSLRADRSADSDVAHGAPSSFAGQIPDAYVRAQGPILGYLCTRTCVHIRAYACGSVHDAPAPGRARTLGKRGIVSDNSNGRRHSLCQ